MRAAVIDIGSNSTKLTIGETVNGEFNILDSLKNVASIGHDTFYKGRISQEIFNQIISILEKYKKVVSDYEITDVKVIATTAVRESENRDIFLDTIKRKTGFDVEVLNVGDVVYYIDAFLSYKLKSAYPIHEKNVLIVELGSGSLDVSLMEKGYTVLNMAVPIGSLRLQQFKTKLDGSLKDTYIALEEYIENQIISLKKSFSGFKIDDIILVDESYSTLIHKILPSAKHDTSFFKFTAHESSQLLAKVTQRNLDDLAHKHDIAGDMAGAIDSYAIILDKLFKLIKQKSFYILETSLSEAILANILFGVELAKKYNKVNQLISVAKFLCNKFGSDLKHDKHVAFMCEELFKKFQGSLGLREDDLLYLLLAAHLQNIGLFISNRSHHKHTEYIINSLSLFRLTEEEIKMIACIARYHRKASPQKTHFLYGTLDPAQQLLVQKLSSIIRLANTLDASHKQKVKKLEVDISRNGEFVIVVYTNDNFILEKVNFNERKRLFEEISGSKVNLQVKHLS